MRQWALGGSRAGELGAGQEHLGLARVHRVDGDPRLLSGFEQLLVILLDLGCFLLQVDGSAKQIDGVEAGPLPDEVVEKGGRVGAEACGEEDDTLATWRSGEDVDELVEAGDGAALSLDLLPCSGLDLPGDSFSLAKLQLSIRNGDDVPDHLGPFVRPGEAGQG